MNKGTQSHVEVFFDTFVLYFVQNAKDILMRKGVKTLSLVFGLLFLSAAILQWNDPDALIWSALYGIAALVSILYFFGKRYFRITLLLGIVYLILAVAFWPDQWEGINLGEGNIDNIERARESLGLMITAFVMFIYAAFRRKLT